MAQRKKEIARRKRDRQTDKETDTETDRQTETDTERDGTKKEMDAGQKGPRVFPLPQRPHRVRLLTLTSVLLGSFPPLAKVLAFRVDTT